MADWNELKHDIGKTVEGVGKELSKLGNSAATKLKLNGLKVELAELYEALGRKSYKNLRDGKVTDLSEIADLLSKIDEKIKVIKEIEKESRTK